MVLHSDGTLWITTVSVRSIRPTVWAMFDYFKYCPLFICTVFMCIVAKHCITGGSNNGI